MDDEMMDFHSSCWLAKDSIGYEPENIHLIIDRTIPDDHGLAPEVLESLTSNFERFVQTLKEMDDAYRAEKWFGGEIIELE